MAAPLSSITRRRRKRQQAINAIAALGLGFLEGYGAQKKRQAEEAKERERQEHEDFRDRLALLTAERAERAEGRAEAAAAESTRRYEIEQGQEQARDLLRQRERQEDIVHRTAREAKADADRALGKEIQLEHLKIRRNLANKPKEKNEYETNLSKWIDYFLTRSPEDFPVRSFVTVMEKGLKGIRADDPDAASTALQVLRRSPTEAFEEGGYGLPAKLVSDPDFLRAFDYFMGRHQGRFFLPSKKDGFYQGLSPELWELPVFEETAGVEGATDDLSEIPE